MADLTAKVAIRAEDGFTPVASKISGAGGKLAKRLDGIGRELADLERKGATAKRLQSLQSRLGQTGQALDAARKRTAALGREIAAAGDPAARKLQREFDKARRESDLLKRSHRGQRDEARSLREQLRSAGVETRKLGDAQRGIASDIDRATRKMDRMAVAAGKVAAAQKRVDRGMERAARGALIAGELRTAGQGLLGLVSAPLQRVREVGAARGELASLGMSRGGVDAVVRRGRELSLDVAGINPASFTSAAYDIRSGISALDDAGVADVTEIAALTARATKADTGQMTEMFAAGYGAFKDSLFGGASDREFAGAFGAQIAKSVEQFRTTGDGMQQAIRSMGAGLAQSGVSLEDQLASLGMLQQQMTGSEAGTAMAAMARNAVVAQGRFASMGLDIRTLDASGNMLSPAELLDQVQRGFGTDEYTTEIGAQIQKAFGDEQAVRFFTALWGQHEAMEANAAALREASAEGDRFVRMMQRRRDDNIDSRMVKLEQRWNDVQLRIGDALVPVLELAAPWIETVADKVAGLIEKFPGATTVLAGVAGAGGLLALAVAPAITSIVSLSLALDYMRKRAAMASATLATRDIGTPGGPGRGRFGRVADKIRGAGKAAKGGAGGLAGKIAGFGRTGGLKALGFVKGKAGLLGALAGGVAIGGTLLSGKLSARDKAEAVTQDAGGIGGGLAGAAAGAAIGSVIPGVGTAIGALAGSIIGSLAGDRIGAFAGKAFRTSQAGGAGAAIESAGIGESAARPNARQLRGLDRRAPVRAAAALAVPLAAAGALPEAGPQADLATALTEAASRSEARPDSGRTQAPPVTYHVTFHIEQRPGESAEDLADRVLDKLEERQRQGRLEGLFDAD